MQKRRGPLSRTRAPLMFANEHRHRKGAWPDLGSRCFRDSHGHLEHRDLVLADHGAKLGIGIDLNACPWRLSCRPLALMYSHSTSMVYLSAGHRTLADHRMFENSTESCPGFCREIGTVPAIIYSLFFRGPTVNQI